MCSCCYFVLYHSPVATSNTVWLLVNFVIFVILFYIIPQQSHQTLCGCWGILSFLLFCFISYPSSHIKHCVAAGEFCHFCYFVLYHSPAATSNTVWLLGNFVIFVILFYIILQQPHQTLCGCWGILSFLLFCFISFPSSHIKHCVAAGEFCHFCYFVLYHSPAATSNTVWLLGNFVIFVILFYIILQQPHQTLCGCWGILSFLLFCFISFPSSHIKHCVAAGKFCHFCYFVLYHSPAATSNTVWLLGNFVIFVILFSNRQGNPFTAKCDYSRV